MGEVWAFNANKDDESTGDFKLLTPGRYKFGIENKTDKVTKKSGLPMVALQLTVLEGPEAGTMFHNVVCIPPGEKGHGFLLRFLHGVGLPYDGEVQFDTDEFIGREFWADVEIETRKWVDQETNEPKEMTTNKIAKILVEEDLQEAAPAEEPAAETTTEEPAAEEPATEEPEEKAQPPKRPAPQPVRRTPPPPAKPAPKVAPKPVPKPAPKPAPKAPAKGAVKRRF